MSTEGDSLPKTRAEWKDRLSPEQYRICRQGGTEPPFSGEYVRTKTPGTYHCVCCDAPLFHSQQKFDSGTGWPSFRAPFNESAVMTKHDTSLGLTRAEVRCASCDAHLGHVFHDGPPPTGLRYCINSVALSLERE